MLTADSRIPDPDISRAGNPVTGNPAETRDFSALSGTLFDLQRGSYVDGPGLRTTVFFKGCNLRCRWCHNPESQRPERELLFFRSLCTGCGACKAVCPAGIAHSAQENVKEARPDAPASCRACGACAAVCPSGARRMAGYSATVAEVMEIVRRDRPFYESTGGGITCSGGECLLQPEFLTALLTACRAEGISTAVDTAGNVPFSAIEPILPLTDLFLYDLKCATSTLHHAGTGVGNERILENLALLAASGARIAIRVPLIPGFNDDPAELAAMREILNRIRPESVEVLPYHRLGESKCTALGRTQDAFAVPSQEALARAKAILLR